MRRGCVERAAQPSSPIRFGEGAARSTQYRADWIRALAWRGCPAPAPLPPPSHSRDAPVRRNPRFLATKPRSGTKSEPSQLDTERVHGERPGRRKLKATDTSLDAPMRARTRFRGQKPRISAHGSPATAPLRRFSPSSRGSPCLCRISVSRGGNASNSRGM